MKPLSILRLGSGALVVATTLTSPEGAVVVTEGVVVSPDPRTWIVPGFTVASNSTPL